MKKRDFNDKKTQKNTNMRTNAHHSYTKGAFLKKTCVGKNP